MAAPRDAPAERSAGGFELVAWWTRLQPIRTAAEVALEVAVFSSDGFRYQEFAAEVRRMRTLGMSMRAIGRALEVDGKTVARALQSG